eukprot:5980661-Prymnesium_polylepis.1
MDMDMGYGHGTRDMGMGMGTGHGTWDMGMDMEHGHGHGNMDMDMGMRAATCAHACVPTTGGWGKARGGAWAVNLQLQRLRVERVLQRVDGPNHLVALELRVVVQVAHAPEERRAVEGRGSPEGARRKALHARGERHVER